jgi:riboflavin kinase/FMN adenylyltransferase
VYLEGDRVRTVADLAELERGSPAVVTIGAFDGVHRGHQFLIRQVVDRARRLDYESAVISFDPRPEVLFRPDSLQFTDGAAKERIISALGVDTLALIPFTRAFSEIPAGTFLLSMLEHINLAELWVGADFAFGHKRSGNVEMLIRSGAASGFAVHVVPRQPLDGVPVSSSLVRELVEKGDVAGAAVYLGHWPSWQGLVVHGDQRGRELGFPTANLEPPPHQLIPATGVYAGYVRFDGQRLPAAISVGYNVHFHGTALKVEAHILDWDGDIYDRVIGIEFVDRVREEREFDTLESLIMEMKHDCDQVRTLLAAAEEPGELIMPEWP